MIQILGGLLGGPFGALFGAQIGASFGAASQINKARKEELQRKGLTPEMLEQANEIGMILKQAVVMGIFQYRRRHIKN